MATTSSRFLAVVLFVAFFALYSEVHAQQQQDEGGEGGGLCITETGEPGCFWCRPGTYNKTLAGAQITVRIPKNWNKVLVIYAHGYSLTIPPPKAFFDNPNRDPSTESAEEILFSKGYALAGTSYSAGGWAVKEGLQDVDYLVRYIESIFYIGCRPKRTILYGVSLGSLIALRKAESKTSPWCGKYDGVVATCPMSAGTTRTIDLALRYNLAYDAAFSKAGIGGWPEEWGTPQLPSSKLTFYDDVLPHIVSQLSSDPNFGFFEFQRLVSFLALQDYYPFTASDQADIYLFTDMYFSTVALAELNKRAHGAAAENKNANYSITAAEKAYLTYFGVNPDTTLEYMNSQQYKACNKARSYLRAYADFTGNLQMPVLTMHTNVDGLVPPSGNVLYKEMVDKKKSEKRLFQVYTGSAGHCNFTPQQLVTSVEVMDKWIATKKKPTEESFPASEGFLPQSFSPGPWPYGN